MKMPHQTTLQQWAALLLTAFMALPLMAHEHKPPPDSGDPHQRPTLNQAKTVSARFDDHGRLWLAWVVGDHLYVNYSDDVGKTYSAPVKVNRTPQKIRAHGESRPQIAVGGNGHLYVVYNQKLGKRFSGHVRFSRSVDGGRTFSSPTIVNSDRQEIGHSFGALAVNRQGHIYITWLDGRDVTAARREGRPYTGSALYYTASFDGGEQFIANTKLQDYSCQCCRIAIALDSKGLPAIVWRQIFDETVRDHALIRFTGATTPTPLRRTSKDGWAIESCPHHGPSLAIAADETYHLAWFTGAAERPGIYYARSSDQGEHFSPPLALGHRAAQPQHPDVMALGGAVYIVWKELGEERTSILLMQSADGGISWSTPRVVAHTAAASDHPLLIASGHTPYLSWQTEAQGYRVIPLNTPTTPEMPK